MSQGGGERCDVVTRFLDSSPFLKARTWTFNLGFLSLLIVALYTFWVSCMYDHTIFIDFCWLCDCARRSAGLVMDVEIHIGKARCYICL